MKFLHVIFLMVVALYVGGVNAQTAIPAVQGLIPPGVEPGDKFYIIFAGSDTVDGAQSSATYQAYAASVKTNDPITDQISGWITLFGHDDSSLVTTSALDYTNIPIYNRNGDKVADNRAELFSSAQDSAIGYDEQGNPNANNIWTGFNFTGGNTGIGDDSLGGNDSLADGCLAGNAAEADSEWAASVLAGGNGCTGVNLGMYVISPAFFIPEPSPLPILNIPGFVILLVLMGLIARRYFARLRT
ncbi:hypothetical protein KO507_10525 [Gilvimarinus agarilyticus]|uniref:hypothetical protein n=1 Tax=Gilvimarinus sp. 2_MG-2023 TaxID=3062666 RepID=UPI001C09FC2B|nr:hypothetical protein [Gilvimarinus sp. 2_MG-2023]MBU2886197.1 hypothetical protein [Gilvimarinus agarilyticus]MDO6570886.1 hypothetical protein [Gilvimarinus sp. 2_MG-2023]